MRRWAFTGLVAVALAAVSRPGERVSSQESSFAPLPPLEAPEAEQVELGKMLFFDPRLSGDASTSCATCHAPEKAWGDGLPLSEGYPGTRYFRNAQTLLNVAHQERLYWDGRLSEADLASVVRDHLTEAHFMQSDGRLIPERLKQVPEYEERFQRAFGGEPTFGRVLAAVSAFLQTLVSRDVPFDRYLAGDSSALSRQAQEGLRLFTGKAGCVRCHAGPLLSDGELHNLGVPEAPDIFADPLRHVSFRRFFKTLGVPGYHVLRQDVGHYAVTKEAGDRGKFRTPSLREVARTGPYMHNGTFRTLEDVLEFYDQGGGDDPNKSALLEPLGLSEREKRALVEFLGSLAGEPVVVQAPELPDYRLRRLGKN